MSKAEDAPQNALANLNAFHFLNVDLNGVPANESKFGNDAFVGDG